MKAILTDQFISELPRPKKQRQVDYFDQDQHGLSLRVSASRKVFSVFYRVRRLQVRHQIGPWPEVSLAVAKREAKALIGRSFELRRQDTAIPTIEQLLDLGERIEPITQRLDALIKERNKTEEERKCLKETGSLLLQVKRLVSKLSHENNREPMKQSPRQGSRRRTNSKAW